MAWPISSRHIEEFKFVFRFFIALLDPSERWTKYWYILFHKSLTLILIYFSHTNTKDVRLLPILYPLILCSLQSLGYVRCYCQVVAETICITKIQKIKNKNLITYQI